jgi:hypothetical protein
VARLKRTAFVCALLLAAASPALAATEVAFSVAGMDPVEIMRIQDPDTSKIRIGYIQSTEFSHSVKGRAKKAEEIEDGIFYYSVIVEKLPEGDFQLEISYDFASADGTSKGIRNRSVVNEEVLKSITDEQLDERAGVHAEAFAQVVYEHFLKAKLTGDEGEITKALTDFFRGLARDLLKSMPKDGIMIIRRWDDLAGAK